MFKSRFKGNKIKIIVYGQHIFVDLWDANKRERESPSAKAYAVLSIFRKS